MTLRRVFPLLLPIVILVVRDGSGMNRVPRDPGKTQVLVVGTIHQIHSTDTNYTYRDLYNILSTYNPDVICVEIRPAEFRKEPYLTEMTMATIWGIDHDRKVYPIDWWENDTRQVRDSLMSLPEYKQKEEELEALEDKDSVLIDFEKKYGTFEKQGQQGYDFWNGREYNEYVMEGYRLSMEILGDSPVNLNYQSRNDSMMALILSAVGENPGRRVIVFTGAEHKHYFDHKLAGNPDVELIDFGSILPLKHSEPGPVLTAFFEDGNDLPYYEEGYPKDMNTYFRTKLVPLMHGRGMDFEPYTVPAKNIVTAEKVIARWKKDTASSSASDMIAFEMGWLNFQKRDYRTAIAFLLPLSRKIESGAVTEPFLLAVTHRNLGLCYDCIGERDSAVACYTRGEELAGTTPFARAIKILFKEYKTQPYRPER